METCNHAGPEGRTCGRPPSHGGTHSNYEPTGPTTFVLREWNNAGEDFRKREKGNLISGNYNEVDRQALVDQCIAEARTYLPAGSVFEVRAKCRPTAGLLWDYGRKAPSFDEQAAHWGIAWYWATAPADCPSGFEKYGLLQEPLFQNHIDEAILDRFAGYELVARIKA